jgi:hypothetical protein
MSNDTHPAFPDPPGAALIGPWDVDFWDYGTPYCSRGFDGTTSTLDHERGQIAITKGGFQYADGTTENRVYLVIPENVSTAGLSGDQARRFAAMVIEAVGVESLGS